MRDVLNLGFSPVTAVELVRMRPKRHSSSLSIPDVTSNCRQSVCLKTSTALYKCTGHSQLVLSRIALCSIRSVVPFCRCGRGLKQPAARSFSSLRLRPRTCTPTALHCSCRPSHQAQAARTAAATAAAAPQQSRRSLSPGGCWWIAWYFACVSYSQQCDGQCPCASDCTGLPDTGARLLQYGVHCCAAGGTLVMVRAQP